MMKEETSTNRYYLDYQDKTESNARTYPRKFPVSLKRAKGSWVEDVEGTRYLDFLCGAGTLVLGHNDDEVNQAMIKMIQEDAPLHTLDLTTPTKDEFVRTLFSLLPEPLHGHAKVQFCSPSGTDATDAAIKLCKTATGRSTVIAFSGAFHGMGHGALSLTGNLGEKSPIPNLMPGVQFMPYPYLYRDPFSLGSDDACVAACCNYFENMLKDPESGVPKPAAVILEAIQGEGGAIPAPKKFLETVRRVTKELGIPMICDEVQAGMGRSGQFFAFSYGGICPDVITMSKGIGGSLPMSVVVYDEKLDAWKPGAHTGTFRGDQLAMKAGTIVMKRVSQPAFLAEVTRKGNRIQDAIKAMQKEFPIIGNVRGRGLMIGIEFIDPNDTHRDLEGIPVANGDIAARIQRKCFERRLIMERGGRNGSTMRCLCALNVTDEEIDFMLDVFRKAVSEVNADVCGK